MRTDVVHGVTDTGLTAEVITPQLRSQLGKLQTRGKVAGLGAGGAAGGDLVSVLHWWASLQGVVSHNTGYLTISPATEKAA